MNLGDIIHMRAPDGLRYRAKIVSMPDGSYERPCAEAEFIEGPCDGRTYVVVGDFEEEEEK